MHKSVEDFVVKRKERLTWCDGIAATWLRLHDIKANTNEIHTKGEDKLDGDKCKDLLVAPLQPEEEYQVWCEGCDDNELLLSTAPVDWFVLSSGLVTGLRDEIPSGGEPSWDGEKRRLTSRLMLALLVVGWRRAMPKKSAMVRPLIVGTAKLSCKTNKKTWIISTGQGHNIKKFHPINHFTKLATYSEDTHISTFLYKAPDFYNNAKTEFKRDLEINFTWNLLSLESEVYHPWQTNTEWPDNCQNRNLSLARDSSSSHYSYITHFLVSIKRIFT